MITNFLKLIILGILFSNLIGCAAQYTRDSYIYRYVETEIIVSPSKKAPQVIKTKAYQAIKDNIDTVAIIAPDSCRQQSAMSSNIEQEDFIRSRCGVEIGIIERGLIEAGFNVISWEMLVSISREKSYLSSAKELDVDVLFSINSLEKIIADTSDVYLKRSYYNSNEAGEKLEPVSMTEYEKRGIREELKDYEGLKAGLTIGAAIDVAAVDAKTGESIWYYQSSVYDVNISEYSEYKVTALFRDVGPGYWRLRMINGRPIWEIEESITTREKDSSEEVSIKRANLKDDVFIRNLKGAVSSFISSFSGGM